MAFLILAQYFSIESRRLVLLKQKPQRIEFAGDDIVVKMKLRKLDILCGSKGRQVFVFYPRKAKYIKHKAFISKLIFFLL